jgi:tungstate transport system substrate-binding protein
MVNLRRILATVALWVAAAAIALAGSPGTAVAQTRFIVLASTTSTEQSGLFRHLLPIFTKDTGIEVRVVAVGTGQALDIGRRGDADVVFVHDQAAEERFLAEGFAEERRDVMFNDFVLVGPKTDPAGARGRDIAAALKKLAVANQPFVSRGDRSGTHTAELRLWRAAGVDIGASKPSGYRECGCGMGPALNMASSTNGYVLTDRGTWLSFRNRGDLVVLVEGDKSLFNQYGVMTLNLIRHPHVKQREARRFADWIVSPTGQAAISSYRIDGEQLFFPNAAR